MSNDINTMSDTQDQLISSGTQLTCEIQTLQKKIGRPKKYINEEERKLAHRIANEKHYETHRKQILDNKKNYYEDNKEVLKVKFSEYYQHKKLIVQTK